MRLSAEWWIAAIDDPDAVLMTPQAIEACNRRALKLDPHLVDLARHPAQLPAAEVEARIRAVGRPDETPLHYPGGATVGAEDWARYERAIGLERLPGRVEPPLGLVIERTDMRRWPTDDAVYKSEETRELDRFQENALFPGDAVALLHESADRRWCFAQSYNYAAWVRRDRVAVGERVAVLRYRDTRPFLVVTGDAVPAWPEPRRPRDEGLQLDMGVRLPLAAPDPAAAAPGAAHAVMLPGRGASGELRFVRGTIDRDADVRRGYLPFTRRNIVHQAFKFLGEPYGWGHSGNARDCTGLVSEVYRTMGILMPRNSAQQGRSPIGTTIALSPGTRAEDKLKAVAQCDVGDLIYSTGHVMMYLGSPDGQPYVIHDLAGAGWMDEDGHYHERRFSGVSVTPLASIHMSRDVTYLDEVYAIKRIR